MSDNGLKTVKLATRGMTCTSCSVLIEARLKRIDGVHEASSDYAREETVVTYDPAKTDVSELIEAVEEVGYEAAQLT